ncbi:MAG: pilin [Clostridia bacterium]
MRQLKKCNLIQKTIASLAILLTLSTAIVIKPVYALEPPTPSPEELEEGKIEEFFSGIGGVLFRPIMGLIVSIGDLFNDLVNLGIVGELGNSVDHADNNSDLTEFLAENPPLENLQDGQEESKTVKTYSIVEEYADGWIDGKYVLPNIKLTPAEIFAGNVAALDANFFKEGTDYSNELGGEKKSIVTKLRSVIATWYVALRNIAIVGLLSVLLYIGIRIVISSSANDKAKYKQFFMDWVVALCLIFFLHYIMSFTMTISESITKAIAGKSTSSGTIKELNISYVNKDGTPYKDGQGQNVFFSSNFIGVARIKAQYGSMQRQAVYTIMYVALSIYTVYFAYVYLKRLLMLAFFTMIAPLVSLTYPLDKIKDGKAQAFNFWFREYMFYALLQPLHMLLYKVFISSAIDLATSNVFYVIIALSFIVPAEKIVKQMFGIKGQTESNLGGFAGGAIAAQAFNALKSKASGGKNKAGQSADNNKIRQAKNPDTKDAMDVLADGDNNNLLSEAPIETAQNAPTKDAPIETTQNAPTKDAPTKTENSEESSPNRDLTGTDLPDSPAQPKPKIKAPVKQGNNRNLTDNLKNAVKRRYVRAGGAKGIAKKFGKAYVTAAMGAIGLGAGIVGGNMSDTIKGLGAGLVAGSALGNKINSKIDNAFSGNGAIGGFINEVRYGDGYAEKEFKKQYINSQANRERILDKNPNMGMKELNNQLAAEAKMMYDTGLSDYSTISAAVKLEEKDGVSHDRAVAIAKLSQNYDNSTFANKSKYDAAQQMLATRLEEKIKNNAGGQLSGEEISKRASAEAAKTLEQIRKIKKL